MTVFPLFLAMGLLAGMRLTECRSPDPLRARVAFLVGTISGTAGALLWSMVVDGTWSIQGGGSWGVVILGVPAVLAYLRWSLGTWDVLHYADAAAPGVAVTAALTRIGCFFAGCNFGTPSDLPWSVRYGAGFPAFEQQLQHGLIPPGAQFALPVHPAQLYESLALLAAVPVLLRMSWVSRRGGELALALSIYYGLFRFLLEFFRADSLPIAAVALSAAQIGSLAVVVTAGWIWACRSRLSTHPQAAWK